MRLHTMKCSQGLRLLTCLYRSVELVIEKRQSGLTMSDSLDHNPNTFMQMPGSTLRVIDLNNELQQTGSEVDRCKAYEMRSEEVKASIAVVSLSKGCSHWQQ